MSRDLGRDVRDLEKLYAKKLSVFFFVFSYPKFTKDFLTLRNPQKPLKRQRKHRNNLVNPCLQLTKLFPPN